MVVIPAGCLLFMLFMQKPFAVYAVYAISSLDTEASLRHRIQNCMKLRRDTTGGCRAVYAVYAISSLDTEVSLRHGTQNTAWGFVGTEQGVAGLTPRP